MSTTSCSSSTPTTGGITNRFSICSVGRCKDGGESVLVICAVWMLYHCWGAARFCYCVSPSCPSPFSFIVLRLVCGARAFKFCSVCFNLQASNLRDLTLSSPMISNLFSVSLLYRWSLSLSRSLWLDKDDPNVASCMSRLSNLYSESVKKLRPSHFSKSCCVWTSSPPRSTVFFIRIEQPPIAPKLTIDFLKVSRETGGNV